MKGNDLRQNVMRKLLRRRDMPAQALNLRTNSTLGAPNMSQAAGAQPVRATTEAASNTMRVPNSLGNGPVKKTKNIQVGRLGNPAITGFWYGINSHTKRSRCQGG